MPFYIFLFPHYAWLPNGFDWLWLLILSLGCTILTYILYLFALRYLSAFTTNLTLTLEPVYGILLAFLIYKENKYFSFTFYIGFALILLAVFLQMRRVALQKDQ
jgi:drug/metabolite transporter (DMT)-like permease